MRAVHAAVSRTLAGGKREATTNFKAIEARLESLREAASLAGALDRLVLGPAPEEKKRREPPPELVDRLEAGKLSRYDRAWEAAISSEAFALGWSFWRLSAWVSIPKAEEWNSRLAERLWPNALVLFAETEEASDASAEAPGGLWRGGWLVTIAPRIGSPDALALDLERWPGSPAGKHGKPSWKRIFPS